NAIAPLDADDTERLAWSAVLSGRDDAAMAAFERLYELRLTAGEPLRAARTAIWTGMRLMSLRQMGHASGLRPPAPRPRDHGGRRLRRARLSSSSRLLPVRSLRRSRGCLRGRDRSLHRRRSSPRS